jgi:hypothetical protein
MTMPGNAARKLAKQDHDAYEVEVVERKDSPGVWTVEATDSDGGIEQAIFAGLEPANAQRNMLGISTAKR